MSWDEAVRWSTDPSATSLQQWHAKLNDLPPDAAEIESVHHCSSAGSADDSWVVDLWIDQKQSSSGKDERLYTVVSQRNHTFYVDAIDKSPPVGCAGKKRRPTLTDWTLPDW